MEAPRGGPLLPSVRPGTLPSIPWDEISIAFERGGRSGSTMESVRSTSGIRPGFVPVRSRSGKGEGRRRGSRWRVPIGGEVFRGGEEKTEDATWGSGRRDGCHVGYGGGRTGAARPVRTRRRGRGEREAGPPGTRSMGPGVTRGLEAQGRAITWQGWSSHRGQANVVCEIGPRSGTCTGNQGELVR